MVSDLAAQKKQKLNARESRGGESSQKQAIAVAGSQEDRAWRLPRIGSQVWRESKPEGSSKMFEEQTVRFSALIPAACPYLSRAQEFCSWKF